MPFRQEILELNKVNPIKKILHLGAHLGNEIEFYQQLNPEVIYWFEANPELIPDLEKNIFKYSNIEQKVFNYAVSSETKKINFNLIYDILWYRKYTGNKDEYNFQSFKEICETFRSFITSNTVSIYKSIFQKLICVSIPEIENQFLVDDNTAEKMFPNYIVEGQDNGRLNTKTYGTKSYNPNTIDEEKRISLKLCFLETQASENDVIITLFERKGECLK